MKANLARLSALHFRSKMKSTQRKIIAVLAATVVIVNMIFFALKKVDSLTFWGIIILGAIVAYLLGKVK